MIGNKIIQKIVCTKKLLYNNNISCSWSCENYSCFSLSVLPKKPLLVLRKPTVNLEVVEARYREKLGLLERKPGHWELVNLGQPWMQLAALAAILCLLCRVEQQQPEPGTKTQPEDAKASPIF